LIASQEAERRRITAELHDSLGQSLAIQPMPLLWRSFVPPVRDRN